MITSLVVATPHLKHQCWWRAECMFIREREVKNLQKPFKPHFVSLRENYPHSELFQSVFSRIRTEYGEIRSITDQNNSKYGHFLPRVYRTLKIKLLMLFETWSMEIIANLYQLLFQKRKEYFFAIDNTDF